MTITEMETRLCLLTKQRADLIQARLATGRAVDPDGSRQNMKPLMDEIDRLDLCPATGTQSPDHRNGTGAMGRDPDGCAHDAARRVPLCGRSPVCAGLRPQ